MNSEFVRIITAMADLANPTEKQMEMLLEGWRNLFEVTQVREEDQLEEFRSYIRMRAAAGSISLVAPTFEIPDPVWTGVCFDCGTKMIPSEMAKKVAGLDSWICPNCGARR